jgi:hypothetical protein
MKAMIEAAMRLRQSVSLWMDVKKPAKSFGISALLSEKEPFKCICHRGRIKNRANMMKTIKVTWPVYSRGPNRATDFDVENDRDI